jgi:hypothetical protein
LFQLIINDSCINNVTVVLKIFRIATIGVVVVNRIIVDELVERLLKFVIETGNVLLKLKLEIQFAIG